MGAICTDCHAGANAFAVHPDDNAFKALESFLASNRLQALMRTASGWYEPIVPASWPMNLRKERRLAGTPSTASCVAGCHTAARSNELPEISKNLTKGFCSTVLKPATEVPPGRATMPRPSNGQSVTAAERTPYVPHINALWQWCDKEAPTARGLEIEFEPGKDTPTHISPPVVREPLFTCGLGVTVGGFVPGAKVTLFITSPSAGNAITVLNTTSNDTDSEVDFALPQPLAKGDVVEAVQEWGVATSTFSRQVGVLDFPQADLPVPEFDADEVYACANSVSVRATQGSLITVTHQGGGAVSATPGNGWFLIGVFSAAPWASPWQDGDVFEAQAKLECASGTWLSPKAKVTATPAPRTLRAPSFDPAQTYAGQSVLGLRTVTYGASSQIQRDLPIPTINLGSTVPAPDGWGANFAVRPTLGRDINAGERFRATPQLYCPGGSTGISVVSPPARPCAEMPAPEIAAPAIGARSVVVLNAMPAARIRVFDGSGAEIGDGQGPLLALSRALVAREVLRVTQMAGSCTNSFAFQIPVEAKE